MNKYRDTDLREALRRKYAEKPVVPHDLNERLMQRIEQEENRHGHNNNHRLAPVIRLVTAIAVAASVVLMVVLHLGKDPDEGMLTAEKRMTVIPSSTIRQPIAEASVISPSAKEYITEPEMKPNVSIKPDEQSIAHIDSAKVKKVQVESSAEPTFTPLDQNVHYAAQEIIEDTLSYQDPARMDEFINKLASFYALPIELTCSAVMDSTVVSAVYVFPDNKKADVFSRLLQAAITYSDEMPGYLLNFSHQQFFFELKDQRRQLQYRWIAERINGRILLYGTNAPVGAQTSSACYQEYRNELMHTNSIHLKTRKI